MPPREDVYIGAHLDDPTEAVERIAGGSGDLDPVAKADALLTAIEKEETNLQKGGGEDPVAKANRLLDEVERSVNDPDYVSKRAREEALAKWRAEPLPPKTFGAGMKFLPAEKVEALAKSHGFGMKESDYFRKF